MPRLILYSILMLCIFACKSPNEESQNKTDIVKTELSGEELARNYCTRCHMFPEPNVQTRKYWNELLPIMSHLLGRKTNNFMSSDEMNPVANRRLLHAGIVPQSSLISDKDWNLIENYYLQNLRDDTDSVHIPTPKTSLSQFKVEPLKIKDVGDGLTYINFNTNKDTYALGFNSGKSSYYLKVDSNGKQIEKTAIPSPLVNVAENSGVELLLLMGELMNVDEPTGRLLFKKDTLRQLINPLERPVDFKLEDFNNDGVSDILVAEFGKFLGGINLYNQENGLKKINIYNKPGAVKFVTKDVNNDGLKDFYCLVSQEQESVYLFINNGNFKFKEQKLLQLPPHYGTTHFDLLDFDGDGDDDIICSSGDLGDFSMSANAYHGIRLFENLGNNTFKQIWFYNQQGSYGTACKDFDNDGDIDIASVGYAHHSLFKIQEGFIYFENISTKNEKWKFKPHTIPNYQDGCLLLINTADIDDDGDTDILLGSNACFLNYSDKKSITEEWGKNGGIVTILRNTLIEN